MSQRNQLFYVLLECWNDVLLEPALERKSLGLNGEPRRTTTEPFGFVVAMTNQTIGLVALNPKGSVVALTNADLGLGCD